MVLKRLSIDSSLAVLLVVFVSFSAGQDPVRLESCVDGVFEIVHNSTQNSITCHSASQSKDAASRLTWSLSIGSREFFSISECLIRRYCENFGTSLNDFVSVTQTALNASTLTVQASFGSQGYWSYLRYRFTDLFSNSVILCEDTRYSNAFAARCTTDYVRPPEGVSCSVRVSTVTSPWTVVSHCDVRSVYSASGRYTCRLMVSANGTSVALGPKTNMTTGPSDGDDSVSGSCNLTLPLSDFGAMENLSVEITPGRKAFIANWQGGNVRRKLESVVLSHNCPRSVMEGDDVDCKCTTNDVGSPTGLLRWNYSQTDRLVQRSVDRKANEREFVCDLQWNGQTLKSLTFKLNVLYQPVSPLTHNCPPYVIEGSDINCSCDVSDTGNPPETLWWSVTKSARLLRHNIQRDDAGTTFACHLEWNGTTLKSLTYTLSVVTDSESVQQAHTRGLVTGVGSVLGAVVLVLVITGAIVFWRRGRHHPPSCTSSRSATGNGRTEEIRADTPRDEEQPQVVIQTDEANEPPNVYDVCETSQIGLKSPYEPLTVKYEPKSAKTDKKKSGQKTSAAIDDANTYENVPRT